ncbi:hypothetical protein N657DRAFT_674906 [Parathielavia appendiculata]|uniref:Uncharacterized protein n=1 Tax=Parathielavia appendiculata TaxID=2587402 RepID=A0AAN6TSJ3_9PEZI|nr:hypothetical protein N657DRAFT_674906 [Parathielavia appendiculata]
MDFITVREDEVTSRLWKYLLAVQEPWINKETSQHIAPGAAKYHLVLKLEGRAAIYISKRFETGQWDSEASENWCRVWLPEMDLGQGGRGFRLWFEPYDGRADDLLRLSSGWDIVIQTSKGAVTRAPQGQQRGRTSTIDHFWTSADLQTVYYGEECRGKSDHYPQVLEVGEGDGPRLAQPAGWDWKKMDKKRVKAELELLYKAIGLTDPRPDRLMVRIRTVDGLSKAFDDVTRLADLGRGREHPPEERELRFQLSLVDSGGGTSHSRGKKS